MSNAATIVWFRNDLRVADNSALAAARQRGGPIVPVFIHAPHQADEWEPGGAGRWWLHHSLVALAEQLEALGSRLVLRAGEPLKELGAIAQQTRAAAVCWNRRYEPELRAGDARVEAGLREAGLEVLTFKAGVLFEPVEIATRDGRPYQVFTPFWKRCLEEPEPETPTPAPSSLPAPARWPASRPLSALKLLPRVDWAGGLRETWLPGEPGAARQLERFLEQGAAGYDNDRDRPDLTGTSRLSPHLHFGEISPRTVWHAAKDRLRGSRSRRLQAGVTSFLRELGWREFGHHLLHHFPHTTDAPLREQFAAFPWSDDEDALAAWQRGATGYPIVDAGMRELWTTGWMHNRVRMVVASFLVKDLLVDWRHGARWFWDTLVDADLANNTLGWQWTAGCGADAAPFFRIFNPVSQGERFDPQGAYVRKWVPEVAGLPDRWLHKPWEAPADVLRDAEVELGGGYPQPLVDHAEARDRALTIFESLKTAKAR